MRNEARRYQSPPQKRIGARSCLEEVTEEVVALVLAADKDQDLAPLVPLAENLEQSEEALLVVGPQLHDLGNVLVHHRSAADQDLNGALENIPGQRLDRLGKRGREEHRLPIRPGVLDDLGDLGLEAQVEHSVGLVEDQVGDPAQVGHLAVARDEQVDHAAWRADHNLGACMEADRIHEESGGHAGVDRPQLGRQSKRTSPAGACERASSSPRLSSEIWLAMPEPP